MSNDQQIAVSNPAAQPEREVPPPVSVAEDAFTPTSSPDDYHLDYIGPDGEPLQLDAAGQAVDTELRATAHEIGLTTDEVAHIAEVFQRPGTERLSTERCEQRLQNLWGGRYQEKMQAIGRMVGEHASPALLDRIDATGLGNNIELMLALDNAASRRRK